MRADNPQSEGRDHLTRSPALECYPPRTVPIHANK